MKTSPWVQSRPFDLSFVMGGAALTLALPVAVMLQPGLLPAFFWAWIVLFEGSHFWATISRTFLDRKFSSENRAVLRASVLFFAVPALAVLHWRSTGSSLAIDLWGFSIFVWSLFHNARQHYGFLSIYSKKAVETANVRQRRVWLLYLAICVPQFYFLLFFKGPLALSFFPKPESLGELKPLIQAVCWVVSAIAGAALTVQLVTRKSGERTLPLFYSWICWIFYSVMFYLVAPREPFFTGAKNGAQLLMLLAIMNSLFHNIQYHAIVWYYARKRYASGDAAKDKDLFGWAARINGSIWSYAGASLLMGSVFGLIVSGLGDWPDFRGVYAPAEMSGLAYVLFFGIIGQHFFLDQFIWRPSKQPELNQYLHAGAS